LLNEAVLLLGEVVERKPRAVEPEQSGMIVDAQFLDLLVAQIDKAREVLAIVGSTNVFIPVDQWIVESRSNATRPQRLDHPREQVGRLQCGCRAKRLAL